MTNKNLANTVLDCFVENRLPALGFQVIADVLLHKAISESIELKESSSFAHNQPPRTSEGHVNWDLIDTSKYKINSICLPSDYTIVTDTHKQLEIVEHIKDKLEEHLQTKNIIEGTIKIMVNTAVIPVIHFIIVYLEYINE